MAAQALAKRIRMDERFELRHQIVVVAERNLQIDTPLDGSEAELFEPADIGFVSFDQPIPGADRLHRLRPELLAQARHVSLQGFCRGPGGLAVPKLLDQAVAGDSLAGVQEQDREQLPLLTTA